MLNLAADIESMSPHSHKCSQDQEAPKGSPLDEVNRLGTNEDFENLTKGLPDFTEDDESKELLSDETISDTRESQYDDSVDDRSKESSPKCNVSTIFTDKTSGDEGAVEDSRNYQDDNVNLQLLREKLTAALFNISIKDDMVKQHSKVAEEAVAGWEKAEKEASALKQELDAAVESKSVLEARVSHLDEALKECVRQLRLGRDEQERKINKAVAERTTELELAKIQLEERLFELHGLVQTCRVSSPDPKLQDKLKNFEIENLALRKQLQLQCEELETRIIERDLSTKVAETASKQHLESIKKIAKLEAECRKLKSLTRIPSSLSNDHSSTVAESLTEIQSDASESNGGGFHERSPSRSSSWASLDQSKVIDRNLHSSKEINLMDDFLEMERLAAFPDTSPRVCTGFEKSVSDTTENKCTAELKAMAHRTAELEEEKAELEMALAQTQRCLDNSQVELIEAQILLEQLERDVQGANEGEQFLKTVADNFEQEAKLLSSQLRSLLGEMERERALSEEKTCRLEELERELNKKEEELQRQQELIANGDLKTKENDLAKSHHDCLEKSLAKLKGLEKQVQEANEEKKSLRSELDGAQAQLCSMSTKIEFLNQQIYTNVKESERMCVEMESLKQQLQKEQALVAQFSTQVKELERELLHKRLELDAKLRVHSNIEMKIKQEDAAGKLADCQKTIASLGRQLKSLATLEDFLIDTASIQPAASSMNSGEPWKLHLNNTFLGSEPLSPTPTRHGFIPFTGHNGGDCTETRALSVSSPFFVNHPGPDHVEDGFAKYFSISRN